MPSGDSQQDPPPNPFVRFKHHIDSNVVSGINTMLGYPTPDTSSFPNGDGDHIPDYRDALNLRSVLFSSYSPAALRHLPQPVPNDLPSNLDGRVFTFEDAFEDLLAVSQGQALPDIGQKYQQRTLLRQMFPEGEPAWFWMRRLRASGLLRIPEPQHLQGDASPANWDDLHRELEKKAAEVWGRHPRDVESPNLWDDTGLKDTARMLGGMFGEVERTLGSLEDAFRGGLRDRESKDSREPLHGEPDTFDEFFSHVQSAYESGQRSWETLMRTMTNGEARYEGGKPALQTQIVEDRDETVDKYGYVHSKVTRREVDQEGNEISRSTSYQMYPASNQQQKSETEDRDTPSLSGGELSNHDEKQAQKNGWFWK